MKSAFAKSRITAPQFFRMDLPEEEKWELVGGQLVAEPAPALKHQLVLDELSRRLGNWLRTHDVALKIPDWDVEFLLDETRRPDLVVALKKGGRLKLDVHGHGSPEFIVEVLSPGQKRRDLGDKKDLYERCGVREYWVVDYQMRQIHQFLPGENGRYVDTLVSRSAIKSRVLTGFSLKLNDLFKVLDDLTD